MVGPLNVKSDVKSLPRDLEEFVSGSGGHGFIIVSFGSNVASILPRDFVDMLATAFGKLKQLVLWRLKGKLCIFVNYPWFCVKSVRYEILSSGHQEFNDRRFTGKFFLAGYIPTFLAKNIKVMDWLPQNDLLAHKDNKAFVSHVGHNSLYESAYHGVPLVCFPLFAEQHANAKKVEHFGLGLAVYHEHTNAQLLSETIKLVVSEQR